MFRFEVTWSGHRATLVSGGPTVTLGVATHRAAAIEGAAWAEAACARILSEVFPAPCQISEPSRVDAMPETVAQFLAEQIEYDGLLPLYAPERSDRRYRRLISDHLRLRRFDRAASGEFVEWLVAEVLPDAPQVSALDERMTEWFLANRFIRPEQSRLDKLVAQSERQFDHRQYATISGRLASAHKHALEGSLTAGGGIVR